MPLLSYPASGENQSHSLEILGRGLDDRLRLSQVVAFLDRPEEILSSECSQTQDFVLERV
jgi:hypothetical protein